MPKLPKKIEERFDETFSPEWWKGFGTTDDINKRGVEGIKSFIATILEEESMKFVQEVEDVRCQYEHEAYGLNSVDSFNNALDHVIQAINLIKEDK